jgi:hypothetical protein
MAQALPWLSTQHESRLPSASFRFPPLPSASCGIPLADPRRQASGMKLGSERTFPSAIATNQTQGITNTTPEPGTDSPVHMTAPRVKLGVPRSVGWALATCRIRLIPPAREGRQQYRTWLPGPSTFGHPDPHRLRATLRAICAMPHPPGRRHHATMRIPHQTRGKGAATTGSKAPRFWTGVLPAASRPRTGSAGSADHLTAVGKGVWGIP